MKKRRDGITRESSGLRLKARDYIIIALDELGLSVAQGIFGSLKSSAKIFDTGCILFCLFASLIAGFKPSLQIIGMLFGTVKRIWKDG
jgi:hypothetical protein